MVSSGGVAVVGSGRLAVAAATGGVFVWVMSRRSCGINNAYHLNGGWYRVWHGGEQTNEDVTKARSEGRRGGAIRDVGHRRAHKRKTAVSARVVHRYALYHRALGVCASRSRQRRERGKRRGRLMAAKWRRASR